MRAIDEYWVVDCFGNEIPLSSLMNYEKSCYAKMSTYYKNQTNKNKIKIQDKE